ncbi:MAG: pilus assembly protein PilM [Myxococcota bacterium]
MARVLGLDLGSYTVKAVVAETTMRGVSVKRYLSAPVPAEGERLARLEAGLAALTAQGPLAVDQVVVSLPGVALATHPITLPFDDPKKIEQTLAFEVEGQLPYDLDDAVFDHQLTATGGGGSSLLVGVMKKAELAPVLELLKAAKLDPRIVTHSGLVYQNLIAPLPPSYLDPGAAVAVVDVGHERVSVAIGRPGGAVEHARTFAGGGLALTKALAKEFSIGLEEAASWKETHGAVGDEVVGPDAERAAAAFVRALVPALRELRPTLKAYTAHTRRPIGQVLLCGGTSKLKGLAGQLQKDLGLPVRLLELPAETRGALRPDQLEAAQAVALALRGSPTGAKASRFNLRRGEFAFKSDFDVMRDKAGQLVAFAAVLLVLLIASGIVRNTVLERREKQVDAVLCDVTRRILGRCEPDYARALNLLQGQESPAAGIPKRSATTLLAELTQRVPADLPVTMEQIVIDLDRISVRCEASNSKNMEDLIASLKQYRCFKEIKEGRVEKSKDGTKVNFRLDIQVECPEDDSGGQEG